MIFCDGALRVKAVERGYQGQRHFRIPPNLVLSYIHFLYLHFCLYYNIFTNSDGCLVETGRVLRLLPGDAKFGFINMH